MSKTIDKTNLGYLGADYQYRLVKAFVEEPGYFQDVYTIVEQNAFTEPLLRQFVGTLKDYYVSCGGVMPSYSTLSTLLKQKARVDTDLEEWDELIKKLQNLSTEGCDTVREIATRFFRQQNMIKVANEIIKRVTNGDDESYEECLKMMEKVLSIGQDDDDGFNPYDIIEDVLSPNCNLPVPTGINVIDDALNGGLDKRKLGVVIGSAGFGKTTFSTAVASYASTCRNESNNYQGFKVLQIVFEDDPKDIAKKHFSRISQTEARNLTKDAYIEDVRKAVEEYDEKELFHGNLVIKKYRPNTKTVLDITNFIKKKINQGFKPDLVIIDYFEPIKKPKLSRTDTKWDTEENCMRELECLAEDFNVALWVMTQGNKESFTSPVVTMGQAGGSVTKVQVGHVIISIARSLEDQANNVATITILKSRQGGSGSSWETVFNNGTSTITFDEAVPSDSNLLYDTAKPAKVESTIHSLGQQLVQQQADVWDPNGMDSSLEFDSPKPLGKKAVSGKAYFVQKSADDWEKNL